MTRVIQIDGAPGAGKTHTLQQKLRSEAGDGIGPTGFWWLTFTRAGRDDVIPELFEVFPDADDVGDRARTLHSLALSLAIRENLIDLNKDGEMDPIITQGNYDGDELDPYADFCRRQGMSYDPDQSDARKLLDGTDDTDHTGNLLFAISDYLRQTCKPPEQWRNAPVDVPIAGDRVVALLEAWEAYKRDAHDIRLFEHGDYVDLAIHAGLTPAVDVLLIDEFQDFAPLEYRLYKLWRDRDVADRIYLAGDPNQSIYSFRGGTPVYFEQTRTHEQIDLKASYRCPEEIAAVGNAVLASHEQTDPRGFAGRAPGGAVEWPSIRNEWDLRGAIIDAADRHTDADTPVFLLTRTNHHLRDLTRDLRAVGIPFTILGTMRSVWRGPLAKMLGFLNNYASGGQAFHSANLRPIVDALPDPTERRKRLGFNLGGVMAREAAAPAFEEFGGALDIAARLQLPAWKRDVLKNAADAPASLTAEEIQAGTIHTAKGLEAPAVFLFTTTSDRTVKRYSRDPTQAAEEHRVYYVGATRASEELHLVDGYFDGPTAPPIRKIRRHERVKA